MFVIVSKCPQKIMINKLIELVVILLLLIFGGHMPRDQSMSVNEILQYNV